MAWVERDPNDHQVPTSPPQAETPISRSGSRPGCSWPHPTWLWHLQEWGNHGFSEQANPLLYVLPMCRKLSWKQEAYPVTIHSKIIGFSKPNCAKYSEGGKKKGHPEVVTIALCDLEQISESNRRIGFSLCGAERLLHSKHSEMCWRGERWQRLMLQACCCRCKCSQLVPLAAFIRAPAAQWSGFIITASASPCYCTALHHQALLLPCTVAAQGGKACLSAGPCLLGN